MALRLSTGFRNKILGTEAFRDIFANGVIYLYSGTQPGSADSAVTGTLLAKVTVGGGTFNFGSPDNGLNFDAPSGGEIQKAADEIWRFVGEANGTVGWGRLMGNTLDELGASDTLARLDFSVGRTGADLNLSSTSITSSQTGTIDTFTYRIPGQ